MRILGFSAFSVLAALSLFTLPLTADSVLVGTSGTLGGYPVTAGQYLAQGFSFSDPVNLTQINFLAYGVFVPCECLVQLTDGLGAGANVLAQSTFNVPVAAFPGQPFSMVLNQNLGPGTYFLVFSTNSDGATLPASTSILPSTIGSVDGTFLLFPANSGFPPASPVAVSFNTPINFQLVGDPVPEPATLLLVGSGLGAVWLRRRLERRTA